MVVINCAALQESLLENELFGHEKGAFTSAVTAKPGLFELADGGTLFIDEIGEMAPPLQAKLLRALEDRRIRRLGSTREIRTDVRFLAATKRKSLRRSSVPLLLTGISGGMCVQLLRGARQSAGCCRAGGVPQVARTDAGDGGGTDGPSVDDARAVELADPPATLGRPQTARATAEANSSTRAGRDMTTIPCGTTRNSVQTAYQHHQAGRYADAARVYQALLEQNPDDVAALHLFRRPAPAVWLSRPGRRADQPGHCPTPDVAAFHSNLAEAHRALGQHEQAADCCRTALRLQPDYPEAANNLGLVLHDLGRDEEAVEQFDAALRLRPDYAIAQNNLGTSLLALGKDDEALEAYRTAIRLDPNLALARANLGQMLVNREQPAEGLPHCQEAVRLQPDLPAAHNNLGNALLALQRWEEARAAYTEAIRLEPGLAIASRQPGTDSPARRRRSARPCRISAGRSSWPLRTPVSTSSWRPHTPWTKTGPLPSLVVSTASGSSPRTPTRTATSAGPTSPTSGRSRRRPRYRRALELQPDHLDAWLNLGLLQEELGEMAEAEACYRQAEARHPHSPLPLARLAVLVRGRLPDADRTGSASTCIRPWARCSA